MYVGGESDDEPSLVWVGKPDDSLSDLTEHLPEAWSVEFIDISTAVSQRESDRPDISGVSEPPGEDVDFERELVALEPTAIVVAGTPPSVDPVSVLERLGRETDVPRYFFATDASDALLDAVSETDPTGWFLGTDRRGVERLAAMIDHHRIAGSRAAKSDLGDATLRQPSNVERADGLDARAQLADSLTAVLPGTVFRREQAAEWSVTTVSEGVEDLTGYSVDQVLADEVNWLADVVYDPDAERVRGVVEDALDLCEPYELTYRIETADGEITPVREYGHGVFVDGELETLEGFVADISIERNRAERLATQRDRIRALHRSAVALESCETDADIYDLLVRTTEEVLGFEYCSVSTAEDDLLTVIARSQSGVPTTVDADEPSTMRSGEGLCGRAFAEQRAIVTPDLSVADMDVDPSPYRSAITIPIGQYGVLQGGSTETGTFDRHDMELTQVLVDHAVMALDGIARESTLRRREHELRDQNERLEQFASVLSHDLKNPLSVARGWTELLDADPDVVARIKDAHDRMDAIIDDVLALARGGEPVTDRESVSIDTVASLAWRTSETEEATLEAHAGTTVAADPTRLRRLFENLFTNAVVHGGETVSIEVGATDRGFFVADDGPGIPEEIRKTAFESGVSGRDQGTGFGLSIVKTIAEAHDWNVRIVDTDRGGARFEFDVSGE